jgi:Holliday junction resolvase RusA-like endonuclease
MRLNIKPISVNECYRGRRFKTPKLEKYKEDLNYLLPRLKIPEGKLKVHYKFGLSSKASDYDNCIKSFQDCLQDKYGFNDNKIYKAIIEKEDVKKGEEFIEFSIDKV